jgi:hypothetical protein
VCDNVFHLETLLSKTPSDTTDLLDFENNYKAVGNRHSNVVVPAAMSTAEDYRFRGDATAWTTCAANQTTNIDFTPSANEDRWVDGGWLLYEAANAGDWVTFQVSHPQAGPVETFIPKFLLQSGKAKDEIRVYAARIPAGLGLRVIYTNVGPNTAYCGINYRLHKRG